MNHAERELIIVMSKGINDELSSVGLTPANGAPSAELSVGIFLTSAAIDLVRKGGIEHTQVSPLDPLRRFKRPPQPRRSGRICTAA